MDAAPAPAPLDFDASFVLSTGREIVATNEELLWWIGQAKDALKKWKALVINNRRKRNLMLKRLGGDKSKWVDNWQKVVEISVQRVNLQTKHEKGLDGLNACARTMQILDETCPGAGPSPDTFDSSRMTICGHLLLDIVNDYLLHPNGYFSRMLGRPWPYMHTPSANSNRHRKHGRIAEARRARKEAEAHQLETEGFCLVGESSSSRVLKAKTKM